MEVIAGTIIDDDGEEVNFADDVLNQIEEGMTIDVWGDINYKSIITTTKKGGGLGKAKIEEHREYVNELVLVGADIQEDEEKEFDMELIKKAKIERDTEIENKKNEETKDGKDTKKGSGINKGSDEKPKRERPKF
jgi:polyhydroxyalkanoate synthesis regulator phasin